MSITHSVYVCIHVRYQQKELTKFFQQTINVGCRYISQNVARGNELWVDRYLTAQEVATYFLTSQDDIVVMYAKYEDAWFVITCTSQNNGDNIAYAMTPDGLYWYRYVENNDLLMFDYARLMRVILKICSGYTLHFLKAYSE